MGENPLVELQNYGQSFWYDNISRALISSGELQRMIQEEGLRGVTSNPSIFHKALQSTDEYDEIIKEILSNNPQISEKELFYEIAIRDIRDACDLLMPVYKETGGDDGYVSIEVDPHYAYDTEATIKEAEALFKRVDRPNVMIKVPATEEGLPAIEELIYRGVNVNVTLLFSVNRYEEVIDRYFKGLEKRLSEEQPLDSVCSVASFFVSRVDTKVDKLLEELLSRAGIEEQKTKILGLMGKTAVANAKMAYVVFKRNFSSDRFLNLRMKSARVQRLLFGSTSTKNPAYSDVLYVEELIGPGTVNTMPDATWKAFKDHGKVSRTLDDRVAEAEEVLKDVESLGINLHRVTEELEKEGVRLFEEAFDALLAILSEKKKKL